MVWSNFLKIKTKYLSCSLKVPRAARGEHPKKKIWCNTPQRPVHHFISLVLGVCGSTPFCTTSYQLIKHIARSLDLSLGSIGLGEHEKTPTEFCLLSVNLFKFESSWTNTSPLERKFFCKGQYVDYRMCCIVTFNISLTKDGTPLN